MDTVQALTCALAIVWINLEFNVQYCSCSDQSCNQHSCDEITLHTCCWCGHKEFLPQCKQRSCDAVALHPVDVDTKSLHNLNTDAEKVENRAQPVIGCVFIYLPKRTWTTMF